MMVQFFPVGERVGKALNTRRKGEALRRILEQSRLPMVLDFSGVDVMTTEFVTETFSELAKKLGRDRFYEKFSFQHLSDEHRKILNPVLEDAWKS